eukprot:12886026-Prorocentrum_lima.AAC.1
MKLVWATDKVALVDQDVKEIILTLHFGLPLMGWGEFSNGVGNQLAQSHLTPRSINLVRIGDEGGCDSEE